MKIHMTENDLHVLRDDLIQNVPLEMVEIRLNHLNQEYLTIPVGHNEAIEIDLENGELVVWLLGWDRTGGVDREIEVGIFTSVEEASHGICNALDAYNSDVRAYEDAMANDGCEE